VADAPRRFPPPWRADKIPGSYVVRDAKRASAYLYSRENEAEARQAKVLTVDEARRFATNLTRLPEQLMTVRPQAPACRQPGLQIVIVQGDGMQQVTFDPPKPAPLIEATPYRCHPTWTMHVGSPYSAAHTVADHPAAINAWAVTARGPAGHRPRRLSTQSASIQKPHSLGKNIISRSATRPGASAHHRT
jgi:hypothetical protein